MGVTRSLELGLSSIIPPDMASAIEDCYSRCEARVSEFAEAIDQQSPPPIIYHYTNDAGLQGILRSGKIWLSDIFGQNDPSELRHGIRHACEMLDVAAPRVHPAGKIFAREFRDLCELGLPHVASYFVCCLSSTKDNLGQWRAYADNARGFALGFDCRQFEQAFVDASKSETFGNMAFPVNYDDNQSRDIQEFIAQEGAQLVALPEGRNLSGSTISEYMKELSINLSVPIIRAAVFFKNSAYKSEDEYRLFQIRAANAAASDVITRPLGAATVKYIEFDWREAAMGSLREIVVGPASADKAEDEVNTLLEESGFDRSSILVHRSKIPYRSQT